MRIRVLSENTANRPGFQTEHGLSFYIETGLHRILFDMGHGEIFAENAKLCGDYRVDNVYKWCIYS